MRPIPQYEPQVKWRYAWAVAKQLLSGWVGPGPTTTAFERKLVRVFDKPYVTATTSGTAALLLAIKSLNLPEGSTILFPAYTMLAGANAARFLGYKVQLVDVDKYTGCMSEPQFRETRDLVKPAAVIYVAHNGHGDNGIIDNCRYNHIPVILDASQALGRDLSGYNADLTVLSFSPPKLVTTGQGGAVAAALDTYHRPIRQWQDHGGDWRQTRIHERIGINLKFNDLAAAYGLAQLERLDELVAQRNRIWSWYRQFLGHDSLWGPYGPRYSTAEPTSGWCAIYKHERAESLVHYLAAFDIQAARYYRAVHENPPYAQPLGTYPQAEELARTLVYLPSSLTLKKHQVRYICRHLSDWATAQQ